MPEDIELDLLRAFLAVVETRNFTRAAERLGQAQSAVSGKVQRLEQRLGCRLFQRTKRVVALTPDGVAFVRDANRMIRLNDEILNSFTGASARGRVRFGATDTSMSYVPPVLAAFGHGHPLVEVELRCDRSWEALDALEAGELDVALVTQPCGRDHGEVLRRDPMTWAAAETAALEHLDPLPLAIFGPGCIYREAAIGALDAIGRRWRLAYTSASRDGLEAAVEAGLAITALPTPLRPRHLRALGEAEGLPPLPMMELQLFTRPAPRSDAVEALIAAIRAALSESQAARTAA